MTFAYRSTCFYFMGHSSALGIPRGIRVRLFNSHTVVYCKKENSDNVYHGPNIYVDAKP
jgi:hypothetical protein